MDYFIRSFSTAYHGPDNDSAVLICSFSLKWQLAKCKVEFLGLANTTVYSKVGDLSAIRVRNFMVTSHR